ncbi:SIS domain-containing protein [Hydrogenovibrio sp. JE_KL2]|uniref:D-sedoheptulose-7-phosphate isomerase n=1 Tax=Hydrogenovibrio sp. JE_KL2 TaxID=2651188 RepID=UPI00128DA9B6|nr:SIS domain-containing protein [Hydrogenovibrio sp. JE_KL2]MPQ75462.1 SIS domain-containing protein [Hydrogenovibrio sp. JE_KL2]
MVRAINALEQNLNASIDAKKTFLLNKEQLEVFNQAVQEAIKRYKSGGRLYIAGNGGSAADAQHLAAEFVSKLARDRAPLPAEALTVDASILTAIGNDYGFDQVFSRQLQCKAGKNDIFLGITTSGNSENILKAVEACKELSIPSIIFTGCYGGKVASKADFCIVAPGAATSTIQEIHIVLAHTLCQCVEAEIFNFID